jgi:hypothetical protein
MTTTTMRSRTTRPVVSELELRHQIDRCLARALFDGDYAGRLLADPTTILDEIECPAQEYLSLRSISATSLHEFAQQARALFWVYSSTRKSSRARSLTHDDVGQLARHDDDPLNTSVGNVLLDAG